MPCIECNVHVMAVTNLWFLTSFETLMGIHIHVAVNCGTLTNPANGRVSYTAGTTFGQTATYSCNTGYRLLGGHSRTCQATGRWSGSVPTCQGMLSLGQTCLRMEKFTIHM